MCRTLHSLLPHYTFNVYVFNELERSMMGYMFRRHRGSTQLFLYEIANTSSARKDRMIFNRREKEEDNDANASFPLLTRL